MRARVLLLIAGLSSSALAANASLAKAEKLLDDLDYDGAAVALLQASKTPNNDVKTVIRILELQGIIAASLDQKNPAVTFFKQLLMLDPAFTLNTKIYSKDQRAPFYQAQRMLVGVRPLKFEVASGRAKPGQVENVAVKVPTDPLSMGKKVRFWVKVDDGKFKEEVATLADGRATARVDAESVSWWAELLGDYDAQLAVLGTADKPMVLKAPAAFDPMVSNIDLSGMRPLALAAAGVGVIALSTGSVFGIRSRMASDRIEKLRAEQDIQNRITSMSMLDAQKVVDAANATALVANLCWAAGAAFIGGGAALWFLEPERTPTGATTLKLNVTGRW